METINKGDHIYWVNDGDVIEGDVIDLDELSLRIQTAEGTIFGKLKPGDPFVGDIPYYQVAKTKEGAIDLVKKGMRVTRATMSAWRDSLDTLRTKEDNHE